MENQNNNSPIIRVLHQLGRSGGTLIAKCLAVMENAILLSEVHPYYRAMVKMQGRAAVPYIPMVQAHNWFNLITDKEVEEFKRTGSPKGFASQISLIDERCKSGGKNLILRDYNNLDFTGINFRAQPAFRFSTVEVLKERFDTLRFFTVRHPADQWISMSKLFTGSITPRLERYFYGYRLFSEQAAKTGFVQYEDFTLDPEAELKKICEQLELPYDPTWQERWADYKKITGDGRARAGKSEITPPRKNTIEPDLLRLFEENADYRQTLELLGYK